MKKNLQLDTWKMWWRSRTPEERESGLAPHLYKITSTTLIEVPMPFGGLIEVFIFSMGRTKHRVVKVGKRQVQLLRDLFLSPSTKKWKVQKRETCIQFWHDGKLLNHLGEPVKRFF